MEQYLQVGKVANSHGVKGEMKVIPLTDNPERFLKLKWLYVERKGALEKHEVESVRFSKNMVLLKLQGIEDMSAVEALKDMYLVIDRENAIKLPKDSFFICDLIGCSVFDEKEQLLGSLEDVLQTGSNDVYVVKNNEGREILIPALKSVVREVLPEQQEVRVTLPKGLLDE